jgi:uncharacterized DUF497 family protein
MVITFDPKKDKVNKRKHGLSLSAAAGFDWDNAVVWPDERYAYSELRECAIGLIGYTLYHITFVDCGDRLRVISLRRANRKETAGYVRQK